MGGEMVAWCCCWWQHGGCEGGAAAAVTVDGGDGDDRDGVAVTCGWGMRLRWEDWFRGVVVRGDGIGGACYDDDDAMVVVGGGGCGSRREGGKARGGAWCSNENVDERPETRLTETEIETIKGNRHRFKAVNELLAI
ncbi:hypothetical protein Tco_1166538 [Tanacetum coccineum]